jgi:MEMO1 family protein
MGEIQGYYIMPHPPIAIPEVGGGEEKKISETLKACGQVAQKVADIRPDSIILVTPHGPVFSDAIAISLGDRIGGSLTKFGAPQVLMDININKELSNKIVEKSSERNIMTAPIDESFVKEYEVEYFLDHGAMVPLYFINQLYSNYNIVHITYGMLSKIQLYQFGMAIKEAVEESSSRAVFIASGDLSHRLSHEGPYGFNSHGPKFDNQLLEILKEGSVDKIFNMDCSLIEGAGECGLRSIYIMLGAMEGNEIKGNLLSYQDTFGVGYGVMDFELIHTGKSNFNILMENKKRRQQDRLKNEDFYVRLARESLTHYLLEGEYIKPPDYVTAEMLNQKRGVFVSLKKDGQLRGCIGTFLPSTESVAQEIIRNAVEAGEHDPRFFPVDEDELEDIDFSVDVLTEPVHASSEELDPKQYGVIVKSRKRSGLLLPDLEGVDTVEQQLDIVLQKAGISPWEEYSIEKFEVIRHR